MKIALSTWLLLNTFILFTPGPTLAKPECDPNYKGACIQPYSQGDVDCGEIKDRNFRSVGSDPHRLDGDKDGIACESR